MLGSKLIKLLIPILKRQGDSSPNFVSLFSLWKIIICTFLTQAIYTLLKRSPLKWKFLRLSSARVKFCQIPYANFETSRFISKFCISLQFHERLFLCSFLAQTIYTLLIRSPSKFAKFLMPIFKQQIDSSPNFISLFSFMKDKSSVLFKLKQYILCLKRAH